MRSLVYISLVFLLLAAPAAAQTPDHGKVGLTVAFPSSVGVIGHLSERVAVRVDFTAAVSDSETTSTSNLQFGGASGVISEANSYGLGISALFYVGRWDNLRTYVSPRVGYAQSHFTTEVTVTPVSESKSRSDAVSVSGTFGGEYVLSRKFSVIAEVGGIYSDSNSESTSFSPASGPFQSTTTRSRGEGRSWGLRSGLGVVFYF